jgi:hypothetical protein
VRTSAGLAVGPKKIHLGAYINNVSKKKVTNKSAAKNTREKTVPQSAVDRVYHQLRAMAMTFHFLPGERLNEAILAKELGVSRTPLREALNRLSTEGFSRLLPTPDSLERR